MRGVREDSHHELELSDRPSVIVFEKAFTAFDPDYGAARPKLPSSQRPGDH